MDTDMDTPPRHPIIQGDVELIAQASIAWDRFAGKRVLVTGAGGFLASYVIEALLHQNEIGLSPPLTVIALVRDPGRLLERFAYARGRADFVTMLADVREPVADDCVVDYIVHAASPASPSAYLADPVGTIACNVDGTRNMLELARRCGARMLFFSTGAVYGSAPDESEPIGELSHGALDPLDPRACYAESKRIGETLCASYVRQYDVAASIARISHVYGPGVDLRDGRVFADFVADVVAGRDIRLKSAGTDRRPFCYVTDATVAFLLLLLEGAAGEAYNVGMDQQLSILELAQLLVEMFPDRGLQLRVPPVESLPPRPSVRAEGVFSLEKIGALGWHPETSPADGFRRMVDYYDDLALRREAGTR